MPEPRKPAEMRSYTPTARERILHALSLGDDVIEQGAHGRAWTNLLDQPIGWLTSSYDAARGAATHLPTMFKEFFGSSDKPVTGGKMSRDEFFAKHRQPVKTKDQFIKDELDSARQSEAYQAAGKTEKERILKRAEAAAEKQYSGYEVSTGKAEAQLEKDWEAYKADIKATEEAERNKSFREKYPGTAAALPGLGIAGALALPYVGKTVANRIRQAPIREWRGAVTEADKAAMTDNAGRLSDLTPRLQQYQKDFSAGKIGGKPSLTETGAGAAGSAATGAGVAAEATMFPDQWDMLNLPEGPRKDAARERALDLKSWGERGAMGALTGFTGYKLPVGKPAPPTQATSGILAKYGTTPEEAVAGIYAPQMAKVEAEAALTAARARAAGASGDLVPHPTAGGPVAGAGQGPSGPFGGAPGGSVAGPGLAPGPVPPPGGVASLPSASELLMKRRNMPTPEQRSASRDTVNRLLAEGADPDNLRVGSVQAAIRNAGDTPPGRHLVQRHIDEARRAASETGTQGADLVREIESRLRRGDYKAAIPLMLAAGAGANEFSTFMAPQE